MSIRDLFPEPPWKGPPLPKIYSKYPVENEPLSVPARSIPAKSNSDRVEAACIPCSRDHLITISSALDEACRMAKSREISNPEIQERIEAVEKELNAWERFDLSPDRVAALPTAEREVVTNASSRARSEIRHKLESTGIRWGQGSYDDLQEIAASASDISKEFRRHITPLIVNKLAVPEETKQQLLKKIPR